MSSAIEAVTLFANLEIGKVSEEEFFKLSTGDLRQLFSRFYFQVLGLEVFFSANLMPEAKEEFSLAICIPPSRLLRNSAKFKKNEETILPEENIFLETLCEILDFSGENKNFFIARTKREINASEKNQRDSEKNILTSLEYLILREFFHWLTGQHLDCENTIITSTRNEEGEIIVFMINEDGSFCLESRPGWLTFFSCNFTRKAIY